jgi:hypothetical protein
MGFSAADAYSHIKKLENTGQLTLPETQETVEVGTIDPATGTFTWIVPTVAQTIVTPPPSQPVVQGPGPSLGESGVNPGGVNPPFHGVEGIPPTNQITEITVGVVATKAVDLRLQFAVIPQRQPGAGERKEAVRASSSEAPAVVKAGVDTTGTGELEQAVPAAAGTSTDETAARLPGVSVEGVLAGETNGGVTITGFPTVSSRVGAITIDVGLVCSEAIQDAPDVSPPVTRQTATIDIPGHDPITVAFFVLRPPVVGMGAFTIPALPMAIVYAPPQTQQLKNVASYSDTETLTRTVTSAITSSTSTKTVQAYSAADLIAKVAGAITAVAAVVGTGGAGAAGGASIAGALSELGEALTGGSKSASDSTADATKQVSGELSLVSDILNGVDGSPPPSETSLSASESDQSLTITLTQLSQYQSAAQLGPGAGDRIVYMPNVRVVWMAVNGEVGIVVLGYDKVTSNAVRDLVEERQRVAAGGSPDAEHGLGLDVAAIDSLLAQDPMAPPLLTAGVPSNVALRPPAIGPPRFVPADPKERSGTSTGANGDQFSVTFESTTEDKEVTTTSHVNVEDAKPGGLGVLFGADDNVETTTTTTLTMSQTIDTKSDDKLTSTVTFFSTGLDDPYDSLNFYDYTFGTYAYLPPNSPFLQGVSTVNASEANVGAAS